MKKRMLLGQIFLFLGGVGAFLSALRHIVFQKDFSANTLSLMAASIVSLMLLNFTRRGA